MNSKERRKKHREFIRQYRNDVLTLRLLGAPASLVRAFDTYRVGAKSELEKYTKYYRERL